MDFLCEHVIRMTMFGLEQIAVGMSETWSTWYVGLVMVFRDGNELDSSLFFLLFKDSSIIECPWYPLGYVHACKYVTTVFTCLNLVPITRFVPVDRVTCATTKWIFPQL